jgi:hypothetical protein
LNNRGPLFGPRSHGAGPATAFPAWPVAEWPCRPVLVARWHARWAQSPCPRPARWRASQQSASGLGGWSLAEIALRMHEEGAKQYLIRGEGAGRQGNDEVVERARLGDVQRRRRRCGGRRRWRCFPAVLSCQGEENGGPKRKEIELWRRSPERRKRVAL